MNSKLYAIFLLGCNLVASGFSAAADPERDVAYDTKHERNVLDFWPALKSSEPGPVVIWFHLGGFRDGELEFCQKHLSN